MRKIEHIGIAVKDIEASNNLFEKLFGEAHYKTEAVASENLMNIIAFDTGTQDTIDSEAVDIVKRARKQSKNKGLMETFWVEFDGANDHSSNDEQPPIKSLLPKVSLAPTERTSVGSIISSYCGEDFHDGDDESCGTLISC